MLDITGDAEELARRLARKIGKSPEDVVRDALEASALMHGLAEPEAEEKGAMIAAAEAVIRRYCSLPLLDDRSADEILGYDDHGLPA